MAQMDASGPVVLVVEDFEDTRVMMRRFLELGGCRVLEASNGREALERVRGEPPQLVIMDLNMPVLDGFSATLRLREQEETRHVPVVAVTAYDTPEFRAAARAVGCAEYVPKPLDYTTLMSLIGRLLPGRGRQLDEEAVV